MGFQSTTQQQDAAKAFANIFLNHKIIKVEDISDLIPIDQIDAYVNFKTEKGRAS